MAIRSGEVITEYRTEYTGDTRDLERASLRARQLLLQNEAAILKSQNALARVGAITSGQDFGAKGARAAATSFGDLAGELGLLSRYGGVGGLGIFGGVVAGTAAAAKEGVAYRETLDKLSKSFTTLTGSTREAARHMAELQAFAARTPFEFEEVAGASQKFQNMGIAARDVIPYLQAVGNAVARAGGGSEQVALVAKALSDVSARGKVSAQEMNQLANNMVDGWRPLEVELGKTRGELFKMAEQGQISAETFLTAFRKAHEGGDAMKRQMETLTGASSTLKDNAKLLLAVGFDPLHKGLKDIAVEAARASNEGFNLARAFDAAASAAVSFMKLNPSAATTWHVLGMNPIGGRGDDRLAANAVRGAFDAAGGLAGQEIARQQEEFSKQFTEQAKRLNDELLRAVQVGGPAAEMIRKLKSELRTAGDDSTLGKVTEQFRQWRADFENMGALAPEGWRGMLDAAERQAAAEARLVDVRIKKLKEQKDAEEAARRETERQRDVLGGLREETQRLAVEIEAFNRSAARQEVLMLGLTSGALGLDAANRKEADGLLTTIQRQKEALSLLESLSAQRAEYVGSLGYEEMAVSRVNKVVADYLRQGRQLSDQQVALAQYAKDAARVYDALKILENIEPPALPAPGPLGVEIPAGLGPTVIGVGDAPHNVYADRVRAREQHLEIADDIADIYRSTFDRIGDGWEGMWQEMLSIARNTMLSISSEMIRAMLTGEKSGAGGIVGFFTNHILGALVGGMFGGASAGGAGSSAAGAVNSLLPSRAAGGPVMAGRLYETHGLGKEREFFVPSTNGQIYNERQARQMRPSGPQQVHHHHYNFNLTMPRVPVSYSEEKTGKQAAKALLSGLMKLR